ncbi:MAG: 50S ribosomal protein L9 [Anaerolineae bacterium]|nr:50S ribosomal protein L9 [Anaerolineae bacterium]
MKVILKDYIYKHGVAGDVVNVADGYARNYLIPRGLAVKVTEGALRENQRLTETVVIRREELKSRESDAAQRIDGVELVFGVKAGKNNKLYGSVTTIDIARALEEKTGVDINRRRISERPLRELGIHEVPVRLSSELSPRLRVVIVREEEVEDYLAGKPVESLAAEYTGEEVQAEAVEEAEEAEAIEAVEVAEAIAEVTDEAEAAEVIEDEPVPAADDAASAGEEAPAE